jgi:hypothetical protein
MDDESFLPMKTEVSQDYPRIGSSRTMGFINDEMDL